MYSYIEAVLERHETTTRFGFVTIPRRHVEPSIPDDVTTNSLEQGVPNIVLRSVVLMQPPPTYEEVMQGTYLNINPFRVRCSL